jgi:general secretion pathway protein K
VLLGIGADPSTASELAQAIVAWRDTQGPEASAMKATQYRAAGLDYAPPEKPFRSLGELSLILGMPLGLVARITPHLTLYSTYGPDQTSTDPIARDAIMLLRKQGGVLPFIGGASQEKVVQVIASAVGANGTRFTRRAILRIDPGSADLPYAVLAWRS